MRLPPVSLCKTQLFTIINLDWNRLQLTATVGGARLYRALKIMSVDFLHVSMDSLEINILLLHAYVTGVCSKWYSQLTHGIFIFLSQCLHRAAFQWHTHTTFHRHCLPTFVLYIILPLLLTRESSVSSVAVNICWPIQRLSEVGSPVILSPSLLIDKFVPIANSCPTELGSSNRWLNMFMVRESSIDGPSSGYPGTRQGLLLQWWDGEWRNEGPKEI